MIVTATAEQPILSRWLCDRIGLVPTMYLMCIGSVLNGKICGVVGYDNYNGSSIVMHSAGEGNWVTRDMLYASFNYPFNICKAEVVIGLVPSGNTQAIRFNKHLGFTVQLNLKGGHPDGSLLIMTLSKDRCRFLNRRKRHGQEIEAAASA